MRIIAITTVALTIFAAGFASAYAQNYTSAYTKLDFDRHCKIFNKHELGIDAKCSGYVQPGKPKSQEWPVYFSEGDLRQMVRFGHAQKEARQWESFGEFNQIGQTIEWRLWDGKPVAAILRWFIENTNPDTGIQDKKHQGQVLVVSTVADVDNRDNACVAGYVDARANKNANKLARQISDSLAPDFVCGIDKPKFHGARGKLAGNPTNMSQ